MKFGNRKNTIAAMLIILRKSDDVSNNIELAKPSYTNGIKMMLSLKQSYELHLQFR